MNDIHSLAHSKWNCKYHIVFAPKYRRIAILGEKGREIGAILRGLCKWKGVNIIEAEICKDHIHMLLEIPPKNGSISLSFCNCFAKSKKQIPSPSGGRQTPRRTMFAPPLNKGKSPLANRLSIEPHRLIDSLFLLFYSLIIGKNRKKIFAFLFCCNNCCKML